MLTCEYFDHEIQSMLEIDSLNANSLEILTNLLVTKHCL